MKRPSLAAALTLAFGGLSLADDTPSVVLPDGASSFAVFVTLPAFEQHYAPEENLEPIDVALIDEASRTIEMAAYVLTDLAVIEALTDAAARGVKVRIYRWPDEHPKRLALTNAEPDLIAAGAQQRFKDPSAPLMHLKTYCVDGATLRFGAANFSRSGLTEQNNDLEITRGSHVCDKFEAAFEAMWSGKP